MPKGHTETWSPKDMGPAPYLALACRIAFSRSCGRERTLCETVQRSFVIEDGYPVSPGHLLVISKEPKPDFFALSDAERLELPSAILLAKAWIEERHAPDWITTWA